MGVKMCLEVLKLVAEDCTDSDYNAKISTKRRNDILIGLNEMSQNFLPLLFHLLEEVTILSQGKTNLHQMRQYLLQQNQTIASMSPEQSAQYQQEEQKVRAVAVAIVDTLATLEEFCRSMPLDWILSPQHDFGAACFHLIRESTGGIQVRALTCLEHLCLRGKLTYTQWINWVRELPQAIQQANQVMAGDQEYKQVQDAASGFSNPSFDALSEQLEFHRALSRMLAALVSAHIAHVTHDKKILKSGHPDQLSFTTYLRVLVDMLHHPSGLICGSQLALWIAMLRDPQISRKKYILQPVISELLTCYLNQMIKVRWDDVDEGTHPQSTLMEASWDDDEEYGRWIMDFRSKTSQLFKHIGNCEPGIAATVLLERMQVIFSAHANGEPRSHLHPQNQQLTQNSEAVRQFEAIVQPLENIMLGMPSWSLSKPQNGKQNNHKRNIRNQTVSGLSEIANLVVSWNPAYLWLRFRQVQLLEALRHLWIHEDSTLLQGIDLLLRYIGAPDEWGDGAIELDGTKRISGETVALRKRSSTALVSVSKQVPQNLVPYIPQLTDATRMLLSSSEINPTNRMHLYEFLSCVATSVEDPAQRVTFVGNVLADAVNTLQSKESQNSISSVEGLLNLVGVAQAGQNPSTVTDPAHVKTVTDRFAAIFSAFNQLLSVGKRCHEANKKRATGGIPTVTQTTSISANPNEQNFPDEGPVSIQDLSIGDPFVPLWIHILPSTLSVLESLMQMWRPENQAYLLANRIQRYSLAISDDEVYLSKKQNSKSGGVFGEGGTAGSVISGVSRRDLNLAPKWSGWLNELRNSCFQLLGLASAQRALYAPELQPLFMRFVQVVTDAQNIQAMENRHCTQKSFIEILLLTCPKPLYMTHLAPVVGPVCEHMKIRLEKSWEPILKAARSRPLSTGDCDAAAAVAQRGGDEWWTEYYARSGLFVGDLDVDTAEAAVEKARIEVTRTFSDVIQSALALKGDWALTLANLAREEQMNKRDHTGKNTKGPPNRFTEGLINADGTPKNNNQAAIDARKLARISSMCHFLFLEHEQTAGFLTLALIQCLDYPDAYTCRRVTKICHRCLETVAWHPRYTELLGTQMFSVAVKNVVVEPKWMVGIEWDMINVVRDIYCRLVCGQIVQPGGQGAGLQQPTSSNKPLTYEQAKTAPRPLQGGGILTTPSPLPQNVLLSLPGITPQMIDQLTQDLKRKRASKDQKDFIKDFLRIAADNYSIAQPESLGIDSLDRATKKESLLHSNVDVNEITDPITPNRSQKKKSSRKSKHKVANRPTGLTAFHLS
ncbi:MAG: hypothetical protein SGBAC_012141 [Bacillariaceae sp.]